MATEPDAGAQSSSAARKLLVPGAIGLAGGVAGLLLTKKDELRAKVPQLGEAIPQVPERIESGIGDLTEDLRGKLDSVLGKDGEASPPEAEDDEVTNRSPDELEQRRAARKERRAKRRRTRS
jgi:hypothetical protein